jgi:deoxyribodipyrimidine photo-lyase
MTSSRDRKVAIVWFRRDLRLADNQALRMALSRGGPVVPFFVLEPDEEATATPGIPSRAWIRRSL